VLDFVREEGYVLKYYINVSEIDEDIVKAIEKSPDSLSEDVHVVIHFWDSTNDAVPIIANYHPILDKFTQCFISVL
jgi:hypothetical protein